MLTGLLQLVVLIICYQFFSSSQKRVVDRILVVSFASLLISSFTYIYLLQNFTYEAKTNARGDIERRVKGFVCTPIAQQMYPDQCPYLGTRELNQIENRPDGLWTVRSINNVHVALVSTWMISFASLTSLTAVFIVYQRRRRARSRR